MSLSSLAMSLVILFTWLPSSSAHGFMAHPGSISDMSKTSPGTRNYDAIAKNVDSLRSPNTAGFCRGAPKGTVTDISLSSATNFTVTMALSLGAQHTGGCSLELIDSDKPNAPGVTISPNEECALKATVGFNTVKASNADSQCPRGVPPKLSTNDMCLGEWSFRPINVDKVTCTNCILRWKWDGTHVSPPEKYENCADVRIASKSGASSGSKTISSKPVQQNLVEPAKPSSQPSSSRKDGKSSVSGPRSSTRPTASATRKASPNLASTSQSQSTCKRSGAVHPYYLCNGSGSFTVCFPASSTSMVLPCPAGTSCKAFGDFIQCL